MLHQAIVDREEQGETLSRLLPTGVAAKLQRDGAHVGETEELVVTVLMSDIRGYSSIAERVGPTDLAHQLNEHRAEMNHAILDATGTVMQFIGDAVMASFGAPVPSDDHADRALEAARVMLERQRVLNERWARADLPEFGLGIGLSTGRVAAALLGSEERLEYTLVGDTVNLAQRLQDLARPAGRIVLSDATREALPRTRRVRGDGRAGHQGSEADGPHVRDRHVWRRHVSTTEPVTSSAPPSATGDLVLVTRGLRKTFESEGAPVRALRGVDFQMTPGEFVAVMGPSGCGKSTLLNLVAGLDTPTDGEISLAGESLVGKTEDELAIMRRRHIGIVFQFFNLLEGMSVLENVTLPAVIAGAPRKRAETRARDLLDLLGLADKAKDAPGVLSGGQRQRLAIARALANEPTLVLADEPTGALDSEGGHEVLELFRRLHAGGQTVLMVTHDDEVAAAGDRIVHMRDGRIVTEAEAAAFTAGASQA